MPKHKWQLWEVRPADERRLRTWVRLAGEAHQHFVFTPNEKVHSARLEKPLSEARVALVSTAGVHLQTQEPFDVKSARGDWSYRELPGDSATDALRISDTHYNHEAADQDVNCIFPLDRLRELADQGIIGAVADTHYSFMGFVPQPKPHLLQNAAEVADKLHAAQVDAVLLTMG